VAKVYLRMKMVSPKMPTIEVRKLGSIVRCQRVKTSTHRDCLNH
jgi:hypothetical protein